MFLLVLVPFAIIFFGERVLGSLREHFLIMFLLVVFELDIVVKYIRFLLLVPVRCSGWLPLTEVPRNTP